MVHTGQAGQVMSMIQGMGFNWVKQQVEWKIFEGSEGQYGFGDLDGIINSANASGINVSVQRGQCTRVGRASLDSMEELAVRPRIRRRLQTSLGALAGNYCGSALKAIEVWNEQNLHYEWGNKPLNPAEYVALLAPSYAAIKGACPSMYVISGALTPAGNNAPVCHGRFHLFGRDVPGGFEQLY